ncbi:unnamed protein product [Vitrella brassicaformis CCMP3155]|uniref:Uncharacterized protein n=1 Tax=Vitrella brassicaformis (strain CCMP3155) TaxID=1169540 RepID=A0A0G4E8K7_VITBC|nr:unnamed protein product [Vitrella brassicaformis CCMP3155]|mmetsp:Transcript_38081/g.108743  ORF Transcript_38081/g.108743 Transcript_38081/m.108743 type:complete len:486 (+) Transcript_38081:29-1486(+)|eukprot:CEL92134.1 unnamed protein product [Vitrella brassicaformis CCMP3155]
MDTHPLNQAARPPSPVEDPLILTFILPFLILAEKLTFLTVCRQWNGTFWGGGRSSFKLTSRMLLNLNPHQMAQVVAKLSHVQRLTVELRLRDANGQRARRVVEEIIGAVFRSPAVRGSLQHLEVFALQHPEQPWEMVVGNIRRHVQRPLAVTLRNLRIKLYRVRGRLMFPAVTFHYVRHLTLINCDIRPDFPDTVGGVPLPGLPGPYDALSDISIVTALSELPGPWRFQHAMVGGFINSPTINQVACLLEAFRHFCAARLERLALRNVAYAPTAGVDFRGVAPPPFHWTDDGTENYLDRLDELIGGGQGTAGGTEPVATYGDALVRGVARFQDALHSYNNLHCIEWTQDADGLDPGGEMAHLRRSYAFIRLLFAPGALAFPAIRDISIAGDRLPSVATTEAAAPSSLPQPQTSRPQLVSRLADALRRDYLRAMRERSAWTKAEKIGGDRQWVAALHRGVVEKLGLLSAWTPNQGGQQAERSWLER